MAVTLKEVSSWLDNKNLNHQCEPPRKLHHLKRNNSDKINQEISCERVSLQTSKLLRY